MHQFPLIGSGFTSTYYRQSQLLRILRLLGALYCNNSVSFLWISFDINYLWGYKLEDMGIGVRIHNILIFFPICLFATAFRRTLFHKRYRRQNDQSVKLLSSEEVQNAVLHKSLRCGTLLILGTFRCHTEIMLSVNCLYISPTQIKMWFAFQLLL